MVSIDGRGSRCKKDMSGTAKLAGSLTNWETPWLLLGPSANAS